MAKSNLSKSTIAVFLVMLTAGIYTTVVQKAAVSQHVSPMFAQGSGGNLPGPPDPGPNGVALIHLT